MSPHLPPSASATREDLRRQMEACGCAACEAMLAVQRAIEADLAMGEAAMLSGYLQQASGVLIRQAVRRVAGS